MTDPAILAESLKTMSDEQKADLNRELGKQILKTIAIRFAVSMGVVVAVHFASQALERHWEETDQSE